MLSLTGTGLLVLLLAAVLVCSLVVIRQWPRLAPNTPKAISARVGLFAVTQIALISLVAAIINDNFEFYETWTQLFGSVAPSGGITMVNSSDSSGGVTVNNGNPDAGALTVDSTGGSSIVGGSNPAVYGEIQYVVIKGLRSGLEQNMEVYLPPQYFQPQYADANFPAVIAASGYPGSDDEMSQQLAFPKQLLGLMNAHQAGPMVMIMTTPMIDQGRDTECTDVPDGPQAETFWAQDVPTAVEAHYRVQTAASGWGVVGFSTGGYCALKLAMMDSDRFKAGASLEGYYAALQDQTTGDLYSSTAFRNENDLTWRLQNLPAPPCALFLTGSPVGDENWTATQQFLHYVKAPMAVTTYFTAQGGHNTETAYADTAPALKWLSRELIQAVPAGTGAGASPSATSSAG